MSLQKPSIARQLSVPLLPKIKEVHFTHMHTFTHLPQWHRVTRLLWHLWNVAERISEQRERHSFFCL